MTLETGHSFKRWTSLSRDEQLKNISLTNYAFEWCKKNPNTVLTYESMNKSGLTHIYSFFIQNFNKSSAGSISYNEVGIMYIPTGVI